MRSSPRRPLILRRRRLNLPNQDGVRGTGTPDQRPAAVIAAERDREPDVPKSATPEPLAALSPGANVGIVSSSAPAEPPGLSGVKVMGHPTIPDTQLVVLPPDSDVESIIQALTARGKESGGPNKFILIAGSSSFHPQVEKLGVQGKAEEMETPAAATAQEHNHPASKEGQELDVSLTNIHWLGKMSSDGLGPCDAKSEPVEKENCTPGADPIKGEEEHEAAAATNPGPAGAFERPPYSYMALIQFAINSTPTKRMTLKDIYTWIEEHFPYFKHVAKPGWKNSIRHNLSLHDMFVRESFSNNKISYWTIHPQANRCLTLDQVFKVSSSPSSACSEPQQQRSLIPDLGRSVQSAPCHTKAPERRMKPLLPRIDSYLIPVQFPIAQSLIFSPVETFSPHPGVSDGPRSSKRVKIVPKVPPTPDAPTMSCPLLPDPPVHSSGFVPRGIHRMTLQRPPYTEAKLELMATLRSPLGTQQAPPATQGYLTWLEVSRLPPLLPQRRDRPHNSVVWRLITAAPAGHRDTVPPPSRMEDNTWDKFLRCSGIRRSEMDSRTLRIRSQGRAPPVDGQGNILPPEGFRRYTAPGNTAAAGSEVTSVPMETGLYSAPQFPHKPRKLTLKLNSGNYQEILQKYRELQRGARSIAPSNSRLTTPRTL